MSNHSKRALRRNPALALDGAIIDREFTELQTLYYFAFGTMEKFQEFIQSCGNERAAAEVLRVTQAMR